MLKLSAERTLGAHPYFVPIEHTPIARRALGPDPLLAPEHACTLEADPTKAREIARNHMKRYCLLDNYANNLKRLGWADADIANGGSDKLVDAIVAWGGAEQVRAVADAHRKGGADHVALQVLGDDILGQLRTIAKTLL
jgi:probable F420-dependent oxidoreductase